MNIRRAFACSLLMVSAALPSPETVAQAYPAKAVRVIVPFPPAGGPPGDLAAYLKTDYERWGKVVKASGIRAE